MAYRLSAGVPHVHHGQQPPFVRSFDSHVHEIDRQMPFVGDLPHRQSCGDVAGDACDDIVPAVAVCISRTWRAPPSVRGSAGPFHTAHHINRNVWKAMMAMTYATAKLSRTDRDATFVPNCRRISATVARHGV